MSYENEISQLVTETEQFIDAVELKKSVLDTAANTAVQNAASAALAAANTAVIAASLAPSADISKGHAVATEAIANLTRMQQDAVSDTERQASLAAGYALSTGTIVQQDLTGVTAAALHRSPNAINSMFIYDTSKDSDGGAWTEKCQNKSWYNESLSGKWLGQQPSEFNARYEGATLGSNLLTNGDFSNGTTGWTAVSAAVAFDGVVDGRAKITIASALSAGAGTGIRQTVSTVIGKIYRVTATVESIGTGSIDIYVVAGTAVLSPTSRLGTIECVFVAAAVTTEIRIGFNGTGETVGDVGYIDNVLVREVTSITTVPNDYFQLTTDGKFYRLWKNMFSRSAEFDNAAWIKYRVSVIPNATTAPDGTLTADKIVSTTVTGEKIVGQTPPAGGKLFSVYAKAGEISSLQLFGFVNGASRGATFNLNDGTFTTIGGVVATSTFVGNGWYRCEALYTPGWAAEISYRLAAGTGNDVDGLFLWGAQLEISDVATAYDPKLAEGSSSEVFRGNKQDFPRLAAIVAEPNNVTIYDLTEPGRPMWMRFANGTNTFLGFTTPTATTTAVGALAGRIMIATSLHGHIVDFSNDDVSIVYSGGSVFYEHINRYISARQANGGFRVTTTGFGYIIKTGTINAVAMAILTDASTDPVTGLKIPTIALGTNGGVSIIKDKGTTSDVANENNVLSVALTPSVVYASRALALLYYANSPGTLPSSYNLISRSGTEAPGFATNIVGYAKVVTSPRNGLFRLTTSYSRMQMIYRNTIDIVRSIVANVTNTFNTGWTVGDVRRTYLSDTISLPATETELIAYPDMSAVNVGWSENRGGTLVYDGNGLLVTNTSAFGGGLVIPLTMYNGDALRITMDIEASGTGGIYGGQVVSGFVFYNTVVGRTQVTIDTILTAPNPAVIFFIINAGQTLRIRYLSIKRLSPDRSHKLARASIVGTLTRTPVASGASLVGYSGFSATNYIQEPFSADLDFGTGEYNTSAWLNIPTTLPIENFALVGSATTISGWANNSMNTFSTTGGSFTAAKTTAGGTGRALSSNTIPVVLNKAYRVTLNVSATTLEFYTIGLSSGSNGRSTAATFTGTGTKVGLIMVNTFNGDFTLAITTASTGSITVDSATIQEVSIANIFDRARSTGPQIQMGVNGGGNITATAFDGTTTRSVTTTYAYNTGTWIKAEANYTTDGTLGISVNGREMAVTRGTPLGNMTLGKNLSSFSESFDNAIWGKTAATITTNNIVAPDGTTTADLLIDNTTNTEHRVGQNISVLAGTYTWSVYAKANTLSWLHIGIPNAVGSRVDTYFDVGNNAVGTIPSGYTASILSVGDGWYRCSVSGPTQASSYMVIATSTNNNIQGYAGTGQSLYIWGAQLESGSTITSYLATNVAPLTIGNNFGLNAPFPGSIALLKLGATVPTSEQATFMYEQEKQMFRANAVSVFPDNNGPIDMSYDDATDRWSTVSTINKSYWTGLVRNSVTPVTTGSYSRIDTRCGIDLSARSGATITNPGVDVSIPTYLLSEDLNKRAEAASKVFKEIVNFDYVGGFTALTTTGSTAITSVANLTYPVSPVGARISGAGIPTNATIVAVVGTTMYISAAATATAAGVSISFLDFELPIGFETETVTTAGAIRREGATADFTRFSDGFIETIRFAVAPGATTWVQIQASKIIS